MKKKKNLGPGTGTEGLIHPGKSMQCHGLKQQNKHLVNDLVYGIENSKK